MDELNAVREYSKETPGFELISEDSKHAIFRADVTTEDGKKAVKDISMGTVDPKSMCETSWCLRSKQDYAKQYQYFVYDKKKQTKYAVDDKTTFFNDVHD